MYSVLPHNVHLGPCDHFVQTGIGQQHISLQTRHPCSLLSAYAGCGNWYLMQVGCQRINYSWWRENIWGTDPVVSRSIDHLYKVVALWIIVSKFIQSECILQSMLCWILLWQQIVLARHQEQAFFVIVYCRLFQLQGWLGLWKLAICCGFGQLQLQLWLDGWQDNFSGKNFGRNPSSWIGDRAGEL